MSYKINMLKVKMNEYLMLNNTYMEMLKNNPNNEGLETITRLLSEKYNEIEKIRVDLSKETKEEVKKDEAEYSFYDSIKKPNKEQEQEEDGGDEEILNSLERGTQRSKAFLGVKDDSFDTVMNNLFSVHMERYLGINSEMIKSVAYDSENRRLVVTVYDFVEKIGDTKTPLMEKLKFAPKTFSFSIDRLDKSGSVLYSEYYSGCTIDSIYRGMLDVNFDEPSLVEISILFNSVVYEASK